MYKNQVINENDNFGRFQNHHAYHNDFQKNRFPQVSYYIPRHVSNGRSEMHFSQYNNSYDHNFDSFRF